MNVSDIFDEVLSRPEMYVGARSVTRLHAFIQGYWIAKYHYDGSAKNDFSRDFTKWIAERFDVKTSHNWASIILFMNGGDECLAFDMTKELWGLYRLGRID